MIRIAACDDNELQRELIEAILEDFISNRLEKTEVKSFDSGAALIDDIEKNGTYDIYILDMIMPEMNGMDVAKNLREHNDDGKIIFLTSTTDYVFSSFDVEAFHYLMKPVDGHKFEEVMTKAFNVINDDAPKIIGIKTQEGTRSINIEDINYISHENRVLIYHMRDKSKFESTMLRTSVAKAVEKITEEPRFIMAGSSMVINLSMIDYMDIGYILLKDQTELFPPERSYGKLKEAWNQYLKNNV